MLFFVLVLSYSCVYSQVIYGRVVGVSDGDTVTLLDSLNRQYRVRVAYVDCPENSQPFGSKAKLYTSGQVYGKAIRVSVVNMDRYGRYVGEVIYNGIDTLSVNLIKSGYAWHYSYYSKSKYLQRLEDTARISKIGLWVDANPIAPSLFRKTKRE